MKNSTFVAFLNVILYGINFNIEASHQISSLSHPSQDQENPSQEPIISTDAYLPASTEPATQSWINKSKYWTQDEDKLLQSLVQKIKNKNWSIITKKFNKATNGQHKTEGQCKNRWEKVLDPNIVKGAWTKEEEEIIAAHVQENGPQKWNICAQRLGTRMGKQCRERWINHLNPAINHAPWSSEEDKRLIELFNKFGPQWSKIATMLPGRTNNAIKNRWNSKLKKHLRRSVCDNSPSHSDFYQNCPKTQANVPTLGTLVNPPCSASNMNSCDKTTLGHSFVNTNEHTPTNDRAQQIDIITNEEPLNFSQDIYEDSLDFSNNPFFE